MSPTESTAKTDANPNRWIWWGAALLTLLLGYLDLARGGETIAPVLLILGYVVMVPLAILKG